jgi:hypothetical protein
MFELRKTLGLVGLPLSLLVAVSASGRALVGCGSELAAVPNADGGLGADGGGASGLPPFTGDNFQRNDAGVGNTQCTNGIDDDGDGLIDEQDPQCTGQLDNDESSFATGIPGDNMDPCKQDCFFDGNSGQGDDKCEWNLKCDPKSPGAPKCPYDPNFKNCPTTQKPECLNLCMARTPNGCDCFGCCNVYKPDGSFVSVMLTSTCSGSAADLADPNKCRPCTQVPSCLNPCDRCELCVGKTTVPSDCGPTGGGDAGTPPLGDGGGTPTCSSGVSCDPTRPCPLRYYCLTGCCVVDPR